MDGIKKAREDCASSPETTHVGDVAAAFHEIEIQLRDVRISEWNAAAPPSQWLEARHQARLVIRNC